MNPKRRRLVLGDIHGAHKALIQVFDRAKFDPNNDELIFLGDVVDGWPDTRQCIDELLKVRHLISILGNHDVWAWQWMQDGWREEIWLSQGGRETVNSYRNHAIPQSHIDYFKNSRLYYLTPDNKLFVHAGFDPKIPIENQSLETLTWDRELFKNAFQKKKKLTTYDEVFLGHTTTESFSLEPVQMGDVWALDQGAGWGGKLTLMDVDTKAYWQSDIVRTLYSAGGRH